MITYDAWAETSWTSAWLSGWGSNLDTWILGSGFWNDGNSWKDNAVWTDQGQL